MMKHILLLIFLGLLSFYGVAQHDYVITVKGDTITGKASIASNKSTVQMITLKNGKDKQRFKVYEIKALIKDDKVYRTIKIENKYHLGLLIKEGYLSLYKYVDVEEMASREFSTSILIKTDGSSLVVPNIGFKKSMSKYLNDCEYIRLALEKNKYKKQELNKIIDDYNNCIAENTKKQRVEVDTNQNPNKTTQIEALIRAIEKDTLLEDKEEIFEMLKDLSSKVKSGDKLPSYLQSALRSSLKSNTAYVNMLNQILLTER